MFKSLNGLIKKIVFSDEELLFEQKLYNGLCLLGVFMMSSMTIVNIFFKLYVESAILGSLAISLAILFLLARFKKIYIFVGIYLLTMTMLSLSYFSSYGIHGAMIFYLISFLVLALTYNPINIHRKIFTLHLLFFSVIFILETYFPQFVLNPFQSQSDLDNNIIINIFTCLFMIFVTINFLRKSYDNERQKNLQQEELLKTNNEQKSMFFINLSHEIKTPLTLLENYLEKYIARKGEDNELVIMRENIQKMRRDIVDYLNFENLERGQLSFDRADVMLLDKIIQDKVLLFKSYAENKSIEINHHIEPEVYIKFNILCIDQIVNNLLENAVKYTPVNGSINIVLSTDTINARFFIQNTGTVIQEDQLPHLFEPFYQMSHDKLNAQGIGMGLYTVKKILNTIGGQILVSSNETSGVIFTILLPLSAERTLPVILDSRTSAVNMNRITPKAIDSTFLLNRPSILLVEDNNDLLHYLSEELSETYNIFVAENGLIALEKLENIPVPDLIISDIMMDKMDGYAFLERTLTNKKISHVPFIFLTAKDKTEEKIAGLDKGVLDFITKPFSLEEIKAKIRTIIGHKARISEAAIIEIKQQFTDNYFLKVRQQHNEVFDANIIKFQLTPREKEIALQIQQGLTYEDIGLKLHISENTVTRHVQNIYKKTESTTKIDMLRKVFA